MIDSEGCCQLCPERGHTFLYPGFSDQSYSVSAASHAVYLLLRAAKVHNFLSLTKRLPVIISSLLPFPHLHSFSSSPFLPFTFPNHSPSPPSFPPSLSPSSPPPFFPPFLPLYLHTLYQTCKMWTSRYESSSGQRTTSCHGYTLTLASTMMRGSSPQLPQKYSRLLWYGPCLILKPNLNLVT